MLSHWCKNDIGLSNDPIQALQGKTVNDLLAAALGVDEAAVPQTCQMRADPGLGLPDSDYELAYGAFLFFEQVQDAKPCRVSQNPEKSRGSGAVRRS